MNEGCRWKSSCTFFVPARLSACHRKPARREETDISVCRAGRKLSGIASLATVNGKYVHKITFTV